MFKKLAIAAISFAALILPCAVEAQGQPQGKPDESFLPYAESGISADVGGGRKIHLICEGEGSPTVILTAGSGNWSETWHKVQPKIAKITRVCAWDRAGFGFSDPSPEPQDVVHTTSDLQRALQAAKIGGPYVLVGHSLGGYESLLFADRNPAMVKGMVLVDPSFPDQFRTLRRNRPDAAALIDGFAKLQDQIVETCIRDLKARAGAPDWSDKDHCLDFPTDYPQALKAARLPELSNPARWETALSLFHNGETDALQTINPARRYGAMPIVVLTATEVEALPPDLNVSKQETQGYAQFTATDWREAHDQMAELSTRGQNRLVQGSSHYIHLIKPEVVIAAIEEVVNDARSGKAH